MARGGARFGGGRRGPAPDPSSARQKRLAAKAAREAITGDRSQAEAKRAIAAKRLTPAPVVLGQRFGQLPRTGFTGRVPAWPLTTSATARERKVWKWAWRTPQAAAWSTEPWRHRTIAMWCRLSVRCEEPDASAASISALVRLAEQIGLTPAGLRLNRWEIQESPGTRAAADETKEPLQLPPPSRDIRDRLTVVRGVTDTTDQSTTN